MSRVKKQILLLIIDVITIWSIIICSFSLRLGYFFFPKGDLLWFVLLAPFIAVPIFYYFGLYRSIIRYIGVRGISIIFQSVSLYTIIWSLAVYFSGVSTISYSSWVSSGVPRGVLIINWFLAVAIIGGLRIFMREFLKGNINFFFTASNSLETKKRSLIYGAGHAGVQLLAVLEHSKEYAPIGFIDDEKDLINRQINGISIYSKDQLQNIINELKIDEILVAIPSASPATRIEIINQLAPLPVVVRILPSLPELVGGNLSIKDLHKVQIKDLLGREPVTPNRKLLSKNIFEKTVMVTGAGGSIGSEICRQIMSLGPNSVVLYEFNELALYNIEKEISELDYYEIKIFPILGNINDKKRLIDVCKLLNVNTIYHTAAYKHVPMVELNNSEGVNNNVFGTLNCAQAAIDSKVETFVLISTDKAVRPANTMGASKRTAELILQALSKTQNQTIFSMVRFGNVLGSSGSVIPLFQDQINNGGPITLTDANMVRYFMSIPEAVELVIQAGAMGVGGDVFILDMGKPIKIYDLVIKMVNLSGLSIRNSENPEGDIEIKYTGLRFGEKLYEELLVGNNVFETDNKLIMRATEEMIDWDVLESILINLDSALKQGNHKKVRELLITLVPEFNPQSSIVDLLYQE
jgi:FlaA1/EpsC-like NDP-sugar epimerase